MIAMRPLGVLSSWTAGGALEGSGWGWLPGWHGALFPHATGYGLSAGPYLVTPLVVRQLWHYLTAHFSGLAHATRWDALQV